MDAPLPSSGCAHICLDYNQENKMKNTIDNQTLQEHIHNVGLQKFLEQLEVIFHRAAIDLADFDDIQLAAQYENAEDETRLMKYKIFGKYPLTTTEAFMNKKYEIMKLRHSIEIAKKMITQSDKRKKALVNDLKLGINEMEREIKKLEK